MPKKKCKSHELKPVHTWKSVIYGNSLGTNLSPLILGQRVAWSPWCQNRETSDATRTQAEGNIEVVEEEVVSGSSMRESWQPAFWSSHTTPSHHEMTWGRYERLSPRRLVIGVYFCTIWIIYWMQGTISNTSPPYFSDEGSCRAVPCHPCAHRGGTGWGERPAGWVQECPVFPYHNIWNFRQIASSA